MLVFVSNLRYAIGPIAYHGHFCIERPIAFLILLLTPDVGFLRTVIERMIPR